MQAWQPTEVENALLRHIINVKGARHQEIKAAEEYAEASAAICRFSNQHGFLDDMAAELADTQIMQAQLCEIHPDLDELISEKRACKLAAAAARFAFPATTAE